MIVNRPLLDPSEKLAEAVLLYVFKISFQAFVEQPVGLLTSQGNHQQIWAKLGLQIVLGIFV